MAERGSGGRELVRGLVAAGVVLLLMVIGVRMMVARMSAVGRGEAGSGSDSGSSSDSHSTSDSHSISTSPSPSPSPSPSTAPATSGAPPPSGSLAAAPPPTTAEGSGFPDGVVHRGTLDAVAVRTVVREALPEIRFCFEWQLQAHPDLAGRVTMQFVIQEDGTVTDAGVLEDALHDETVTNCFTHVMSHLRFPPPEGGTVGVNYPFALDGSPDARRPEGI